MRQRNVRMFRLHAWPACLKLFKPPRRAPVDSEGPDCEGLILTCFYEGGGTAQLPARDPPSTRLGNRRVHVPRVDLGRFSTDLPFGILLHLRVGRGSHAPDRPSVCSLFIFIFLLLVFLPVVIEEPPFLWKREEERKGKREGTRLPPKKERPESELELRLLPFARFCLLAASPPFRSPYPTYPTLPPSNIVMAEDPFVTSTAQTTQPHIYRPIPRRNFSTHTESSDSPSGDASSSYYYQNTPPPAAPSSEANSRPSDFLAQLNARLLRTYNARDAEGDAPAGPGAPPPRNKSLLNMTSSTLYGIYDDVGSATADERSVAQTPWGTGAETPAHSGMGLVGGSIDSGNMNTAIAGGKSSSVRRRGAPGTLLQQQQREGLSQRRGSKVQARRRPARRGASKYAVILGKLAALFTFGVAYGVVVSHLHERRELAAVRVEAVDRGSWVYLAAWGFAGMGLGSLLPYVDLLWDGEGCEGPEPEAEKETSFTEQWNEVVRSVGAFMGIAFAIVSSPPPAPPLKSGTRV